MPGVRHVVMLRLVDTATDEQKAAILSALGELPAKIPQIKSYSFGYDLGLPTGGNPANHTLAIVADFSNAQDVATYASHPAHLDAIARTIRPVVAQGGRAAVQFEMP
eukprot:jgi/Chlat1/2632/Chrsp178S02476